VSLLQPKGTKGAKDDHKKTTTTHTSHITVSSYFTTSFFLSIHQSLAAYIHNSASFLQLSAAPFEQNTTTSLVTGAPSSTFNAANQSYNMAILSTLSGWVAVIALGGGYYYYMKEKKPSAPATKQAGKSIDPKEPKAKRAPAKPEKAARKKASQPAPEVERPDQGFSTSISNDRDDGIDNREFARQISNIKSGHVPQGKVNPEKKQKSIKQSKAQEKQVAAESSDNADAPSSATGGDADDDQSSVNSPELKATPVTVLTSLPHKHIFVH
jgi:hypothetical protein